MYRELQRERIKPAKPKPRPYGSFDADDDGVCAWDDYLEDPPDWAC